MNKEETQYVLVNLCDDTMKKLVRFMDEEDINDFNRAIKILIEMVELK